MVSHRAQLLQHAVFDLRFGSRVVQMAPPGLSDKRQRRANQLTY